jgi:hypothetical protein
MPRSPHDREHTFRSILSKGLECSPSNLQKEYPDYSIGRWGDPAGVADASFFKCYQGMRYLDVAKRKFVVGYFIMTVKNIMEQCGLDDASDESILR